MPGMPANGVASKLSAEELEANQDEKGQKKPKAGAALPAGAGKPVASSAVIKSGDVGTLKADLKGAKQLFLVVTDAGDGFVADWANWMEPTLVKADGSRIKLSEIKPRQAEVGWGQVGINRNANGQEMRVQGFRWLLDLAPAPSMLAFDLPEGVTAFESKVGIDNGGTDQGSGSTVVFHVFAQAGEEAARQFPERAERRETVWF